MMVAMVKEADLDRLDRGAGGLRGPGCHGSGQAVGFQAGHGARLPLPDLGTLS